MKRLVVLTLVATLAVFTNACGGDPTGDGGGGLQTEKLPEIEATPSSIEFPAITPGNTQTIEVEIQNVGAGDDLVIYDVYIQDSSAPFTFTGPQITTLSQGSSDVIQVTYTPETLGTAPSALVVESNATTKPHLSIPIKVGASSEDLVIAPNPINFGDVLGGQSGIETVTITNLSKDIEVANLFIQIGSSLDFSITYKPELPAVLHANDELTFDVAYTPTGFDADDGFLVVAIKEEGTQSLIEVPMHGQEVGPEINATPGMIDFGWVIKGDTETADVIIYNMGQHDLIVDALYFSQPGNEDLAVAQTPDLPFSVAAGSNQKISISWNPQTFFEPTTEPIGGFVIKSNDADEALVNIPVYGNIDAPSIRVIPADQVNFGIVAQNWEMPRTLTIENVGHAPLTVYSMEIIENSALDEFAVTPDPDFPPSDGSGEAQVLMNSDEQTNSVDVELTFTNNGPEVGDEAGKLKILSDDPLTPEILVDLVAKRGGTPECKITFAPQKLYYNIVAHGSEKTMAINVVNSGSGFCSWKSGKVIECTSFMGMMNTCYESGGPSPNFLPQGYPIPMQDGIAPGTAKPIQIMFKPPTSIPWIPLFESYIAALQVTYTESYSVPGVNTEHKYPEADTMGQVPWNLQGESGVADIAVLPGEVKFGLVTIGCLSQTFTLKIYNAGTAPLDVTDLYTNNCGPEFIIMDFPGLPAAVEPSSYIEVKVAYLPQVEGVKECDLIVESSDLDTPLYHVPMKGEGTYETEQTDYFTQIDGKKVDLLFVIDESGSMCGEQSNLANNFDYLTEKAAQWQNDYQIAIVTTNISDEEYTGKMVGSPRIITKDTVSVFPGNVEDIGCGGSGTQESGIEAARRALETPLAYDEEIACSCANDDPCQNTCSEGYACVGGGCGGHNRGFLRDDAALEIIFLSDEEDQSPGSVPFYIDYFKSIKGVMNEGLFHAHAIVGDKPSGCNISQDEGADAGKRYIDVQEATGGEFGSICDSSFATVLEDIGDTAFGNQVQFFLSAQADPNNVKVWVDSGTGYQECLNGWYFEPASSSVIFDETGPCMPQPNDEIKIWYQMICNSL